MTPEVIRLMRQSAAARAKQFRRDYGIWTAPVNCFQVLEKIQKSGRINLEVEEIRHMSDAFDAQACYAAKYRCYLILIRHVEDDWKKYSPRRRCNFTLAHELGHIFCGHLERPMDMKTPETIRLEDEEANAFAAELLMPVSMAGLFCSVQEAADGLLVSEAAMRRRLEETELLFALRTCPVCGFDRIPPAAGYCRKCGHRFPTGGVNPEEDEIYYVPPLLKKCMQCGFGDSVGMGEKCINCEYPMRNRCMREYNQEPHGCFADAKFCDLCGAETIYKWCIEEMGEDLSASSR